MRRTLVTTDPNDAQPGAITPQPGYGTPPPPPPAQYAGYAPMPGQTGEIGKVRKTGVCILLAIVTLGIYTWVWWYQTHDEMKRHSGRGMGGGLALVLAIFVGVAMPYITSSEVGDLYEARGQAKPVSALTGLWNFPGVFILVGPIIWFVKTNGALNDYWRSVGATS
jgi:hypothetical protein